MGYKARAGNHAVLLAIPKFNCRWIYITGIGMPAKGFSRMILNVKFKFCGFLGR